MSDLFSIRNKNSLQTTAFWQLNALELRKELEKLKKEKKEEKEIQTKIATFYPLLQWDAKVPLKVWAMQIVNHLAKNLFAPYVKFYLAEENHVSQLRLTPLATFGDPNMDEGLKQNNLLEEILVSGKKRIFLADEKNKFLLRTGLGDIIIKEIQIIPLVFNKKSEGLLLVGFVKKPETSEKLLERYIALIAPSLNAIKQQRTIQKLLEQAQIQNEMLSAQEEELRQNLEEMESIQEQLRNTQKFIEMQRNQLSAVINSMKAMIVAVNKEGMVTLFNPPAEKYFSKALQIELRPNTPLLPELGEIKDKSSLVYLFKGALKNRTSRALLEDKRVGKHFEVVISPVLSEKGEVEGACMVAQDVTELLETEEELKRNQRRFRYLVENLPGIVYIAKARSDASLQVEFLSKRFEEYTGINPLEIMSGKYPYMDVVHPQDREMLAEKIEQALTQKKDMELEHRLQTASGETIWVYHKAKPYADEQGLFLDGFMLDITEKVYLNKHLEEEVKKRTAQLRETLTELQGLKDQLIHSEKMAILGQMFAGIAHEVKTPVGAIIGSVVNIEEQFPQLMEKLPLLTLKLGDKTPLFMQFASKIIKEQHFISSREARKLRRKLTNRLSENNVSAAEIIARRLISAGWDKPELGKYTELFQEEIGLPVSEVIFLIGQLHMNIDNIQVGGQKVKKLLEAIKKYTHASASEEKIPTNVVETIETILVLYHNQIKYNIQLETHFEDVPEILANPDELGQVWTNLISNALQAMNYQGKLIINVKNEPEFVVVEIIDSGKGIPEEIIDKIFNPFFTTKARGEGTGLGLHLSKQIIDKHNGKIEVASRPGETKFKISLPKK